MVDELEQEYTVLKDGVNVNLPIGLNLCVLLFYPLQRMT